MSYKEKFQVAFDKCVGDTSNEHDVIQCFNQYCSDQITDPIELNECLSYITHPFDELNEFLAKFKTRDNKILSRDDIGNRDECISMNTCKKLVLVDKNIISLPPEIGELKQLESLHLESNQLNDLPPEIGRLQQLRILILGNNNLEYLPPEIGDLKQLETLWIRNNKLRKLPMSMRNLTKIENIDTSGNINLPIYQQYHVFDSEKIERFLQTIF